MLATVGKGRKKRQTHKLVPPKTRKKDKSQESPCKMQRDRRQKARRERKVKGQEARGMQTERGERQEARGWGEQK